jgi:hypothetical protein
MAVCSSACTVELGFSCKYSVDILKNIQVWLNSAKTVNTWYEQNVDVGLIRFLALTWLLLILIENCNKDTNFLLSSCDLHDA